MTCPMTWMAASILNGPLPVHEARARLGVTRTHAVMRPNVLDADEIAEAYPLRRLSPRQVSDDARAFIVANYAGMSNEAIGGCLGMSPKSVAALAKKVGLRKSAAYMKAMREQFSISRRSRPQQAAARPA